MGNFFSLFSDTALEKRLLRKPKHSSHAQQSVLSNDAESNRQSQRASLSNNVLSNRQSQGDSSLVRREPRRHFSNALRMRHR